MPRFVLSIWRKQWNYCGTVNVFSVSYLHSCRCNFQYSPHYGTKYCVEFLSNFGIRLIRHRLILLPSVEKSSDALQAFLSIAPYCVKFQFSWHICIPVCFIHTKMVTLKHSQLSTRWTWSSSPQVTALKTLHTIYILDISLCSSPSFGS